MCHVMRSYSATNVGINVLEYHYVANQMPAAVK